MNRRQLLAATCGAALLVAGCGSSSTSTPTSAGGAASAKTVAAADPITITKAWARTTPAQVTTGAAYFSVVSTADDSITSVKVDAGIAKSAEMHQMSMGGDASATTAAGSSTTMGPMSGGTMAGTTMAPAMTMTPVDSIPLKAGMPFSLAPGSYHIMLIDLVKPLTKGETFPMTIMFAKAGSRTVTVTVQDDAP
jgi:periplasmic copper chaperone A